MGRDEDSPQDGASLAGRFALFEFQPEDHDRLRWAHDLLAGDREALVEQFYGFVRASPGLGRLLPEGHGFQRLKGAQARYFESLTGGAYDEQYVRERMQIGRVHQRVGLRPEWYLAAYRKYVALMLRHLAERAGGVPPGFLDAAESIQKIVAFDTQLALDAYFEEAKAEVARERAAGLARYRAVFEMAPLGIAHASAGGAVTMANDRLGEMLGHAAGELPGMDLRQLFHADELEPLDNALYALLDGSDAIHSAIYRLVRGDGGTCWARVSFALSRDAETGEPFHVLIFDDVTQARAQKEMLDRTREQLARTSARFARVSDNIPIALAQIDRDGRYIYANRAYRNLPGMVDADVVGKRVPEVLAPEVYAEIEPRVRAVLQGAEVAFQHDGPLASLAVRYVPSRDGDCRIDGYYVIGEDVSERVRAQLALADSEARYRSLFESSVDAIVLVEDGMVIDHNRSAETLLEAARGGLLGCPFVGMLMERAAGDPRLPSLVSTALAQASPGVSQRLDLALRLGSGRVVHLDASFTGVAHSGAAFVQVILRDLSERRRAEQQVRALNATLEERIAERTAELTVANRELEAFSYTVSHDLRTPLRAIHGFSRMLEEDMGDRLDAESRGHLEKVRAAALRMDRMLSDLLHLSRVSRKPLDRARVNLTRIATGVVADLMSVEPRATVVEVAPGLSAEGDPGLLRNVLENLLSNAWKYSSGRTGARIEVGSTDTARGQAFFVRDNGVGFDMAHASKLFGVFVRLHHAHEFPGEGVGLATVQRIVQRHGGDVWAQAAPGAGATFYFTLRSSSPEGR